MSARLCTPVSNNGNEVENWAKFDTVILPNVFLTYTDGWVKSLLGWSGERESFARGSEFCNVDVY